MTNDKNNQQTKGQKFASKAYSLVDKVVENDKAKYKTAALCFPALILSCGLSQAVAFAYSKEDDYKIYIGDLVKVVKTVTGEDIFIALDEDGKPKSVPEIICGLKLQNYMRLTRDFLEASAWLKRYAEAKIPKGSGAEK